MAAQVTQASSDSSPVLKWPLNSVAEPNWVAGGCDKGDDDERRSYDIGVITLQNPVPASVAQPVQINFGDRSDLDGSYFTAGYGAIGTNGDLLCGGPGHTACVPFNNGPRRNGRIPNLVYTDDDCDKIVAEGHCWHTPIYRSALYADGITQSLSGDSGSPIVGFKPGSTVAQLVGIHVGRQDTDTWSYAVRMMVRVRLANTYIRQFVTANIPGLSNDQDNDGVSDVADNCKPGDCVNNPFVGCKENNPDQADVDGDGRGDACDNCSPTNAKRCPAGAACSNPGQNDADGDGYGDICDPFPGCADNDMFKCAGCGGLFEDRYCAFNGGTNCGPNRFTPICISNASCPAAIVLPGLPPQGCLLDGGPIGRCRYPGDDDGDGRSDACDSCRGFDNRVHASDAFSNDTSNYEAERHSGQSHLGDACDPAPIAIVSNPENPPAVTTINGITTQPTTAEIENHTFPTYNSRGKITDTSITTTPTGTVRFRGCQCPPNSADCVGPDGDCKAADPLGTFQHLWKVIKVSNASGTLLSPAATATGEVFSNAATAPPKNWTWKWKDDLNAGIFQSSLLVTTAADGSTLQYPYLLGGIATEVDTSAAWTTGRPREDSNDLRYTFVQAYPGLIGTKSNGGLPGLPQYGSNCVYSPACALWANWKKLIATNPGDLIYDEGLSLGFPHDGVVDHMKDDIRTQVLASSSLARNLSALGSYVVAPAAESTRARRSNGDYREFALLPPSLTTTSPVRIARLTRQGLKLDARVMTGGVSGLQAGGLGGAQGEAIALGASSIESDDSLFGESTGASSLGSSQTSTTSPSGGIEGYHALMSTSLDRIFVAGGTQDGDQNQIIWAYDLQQRRWSPAIHQATPAPTGQVRSMAYDPARQFLYVLFNSDGSYVELVRYDLKHDTASRLATFANNQTYPGAYLSVLSDGTIVLTASNPQGTISYAYSPIRFTFLGVNQSSLTSPFPPQLGATGLVLPRVNASKHVTYSTLTTTSFSGGSPCTAL